MSGPTTTRCALLSAILFTVPVVAQDPERAGSSKTESSKYAAPTRETMKASELMGLNLKSHRDETVGEIEDCLIDLRGQRAEFLIVSAGGFLGIGEHHTIVPFRALSLRRSDGSLEGRIETTKERLKNAPVFEEKTWRRQVTDATWRHALDRHYDVPYDVDRFASGSSNAFVKASELLGAGVENAAGDGIAKIEDLAIELSGGYVAYAQLDVGGFLGIGEKSYPVPLRKISRIGVEDPRFVTALGKADLEKAPAFTRSEKQSEDFILSIHRFYHCVPPWEIGAETEIASLSTEPVEIPIRISAQEPHRFLVRVDTITWASGRRERDTGRDRSSETGSSKDPREAGDRSEESDRETSSRRDESDDGLRNENGALLGAAAVRSVEAFDVELRGRGEEDGGEKKVEVRITFADQPHLNTGPALPADERSTARSSADAYTFTASVDEAGRVSDVQVLSGHKPDEDGASGDTSNDRDSAAGRKSDRDERSVESPSDDPTEARSGQPHGRMSKEKARRLVTWLVGAGLHGRKLQPGARIDPRRLAPEEDLRGGSSADQERRSESAASPESVSWTDSVNDLALKFEGTSQDGAVFSIVAATSPSSRIEPSSDQSGSRGLSTDQSGSNKDRKSETATSNRDRDPSERTADRAASSGRLHRATDDYDPNRVGTVVYSLDDGLLDWMAARLGKSIHEGRPHSSASPGEQAEQAGGESERTRPSTTGSRGWDIQHARASMKLTIERL